MKCLQAFKWAFWGEIKPHMHRFARYIEIEPNWPGRSLLMHAASLRGHSVDECSKFRLFKARRAMQTITAWCGHLPPVVDGTFE